MSTTWRRQVTAGVAGLVAGLAVGLPAALIPGHVDDTVETETAAPAYGPGGQGAGDYLRQIADRLAADHVYVAPEAHVDLSEDELAQVRRAATAAETPVYLAWLPDRDRAGSPGYRLTYDALDQLMATVGEKGYYAVMDGPTLAITDAVGYRRPYADDELLLGRPGEALTRYVAALGDYPPEPPYDDPADRDGYWGGPASATTAGLLMGGGGFLGLLALVGLAGLIRRAAQ